MLPSCIYRSRTYWQLLILDLQKKKKHLKMIGRSFWFRTLQASVFISADPILVLVLISYFYEVKTCRICKISRLDVLIIIRIFKILWSSNTCFLLVIVSWGWKLHLLVLLYFSTFFWYKFGLLYMDCKFTDKSS